MRILAIRGRNLASLAGDFAVDFEAEPLAGAGIFAITGPTGAGKSTLLDAICLALFNTLPRLSLAQSRTRIETGQGDELSADDPRAILRHGEGEGFAEVDFLAHDGVPYRARWSVQRARKQPRGRMQSSSHSFERLDTGEQLGGTRTETLNEIQRVVGLNADQFRRAVLLAQGDFDAFIRADANERALLLERLTGSDIYARLGQAAYEKAAVLRQRLQSLEEQIAAQRGLDDAARAVLEADHARVEAQVAKLQEELDALDAASRWQERREELGNLLAKSEAEFVSAEHARAMADERRQALATKQRAFALAQAWSDLDEQRRALALTEGRADECVQAVIRAAQAVERAQEVLHQAEQALAEVQAEAAALAPELDAARALDQSLADVGRALTQLEGERVVHARQVQEARALELGADQALQKASSECSTLAEWLDGHQHLAKWEAQEAELIEQLEAHAAVAVELAASERQLAEAEAVSADARARLETAREAAAKQEAVHLQAEENLIRVRKNAPEEDHLAALVEERNGLHELLGLHASWQAALAKAQDCVGILSRLQAETEKAGQEGMAADARHREIAAALPVLQGQLEEAQRTQRLMEAAGGHHAEQLREALVDGQPCPVCGSREHELSALDAFIGEKIQEARQRTQSLEADLTARRQELAQLAERTRQVNAQAGRLRAEADAQRRAVIDAQQQADILAQNVAAAAAPYMLDPAADDAAEQLSQRLAQAEEAYRDAFIVRKKLAAAQTTETEAREQLETARQAVRAAEEQARQAEQQRQALLARQSQLSTEQQRLGSALDRSVAAHLNWRELPDATKTIQAQIGEWRRHVDARHAAEAALPALHRTLDEARMAASAAAARLEMTQHRYTVGTSERERLRAERARLLCGKSVEDVAIRLEKARLAAQTTLDEAKEAYVEAKQHQSEAQVRQQEVARQLDELTQSIRQRSAAFCAKLQEAGLTEAEVSAAASAGRDALRQEAEALQAIDQAVIQAQAAVVARRDDLLRHESTDRPAVLGEALAQAVIQVTTAQQEAQTRLKDLSFSLRRDDEVRTQTATLRAALEHERAVARPWLELSEVIGDREGKGFRRFAQGLTLDRLLEHANARLAELAPRYALERGQGGDMVIQVIDHDMAGEVRGVHNLSGGERFLVSLALALGLAEMSTGRGLRIESLFIDEGFGALDSASLGQAISVLEHLHASGRRVGVISHVEEVKERIPVKIDIVPVARGRSQVSVTAL